MRLASQQRALEAASAQASTSAPVPAAPYANQSSSQTQGTIFDLIDSDEKKGMPKEAVNFEVLPTYEEAANTGVTPNTATMKSAEATYVPASVNQSLTSRGLSLNDFNMALTSYREGDCCGKGRARRAAKNLVRELAAQEIARLEATHGSLALKQRKQVRRDLEPLKDVLKNVVREVRRE